MSKPNERVLVADIGGTNARCAVATFEGADVKLQSLKIHDSADYPSLTAVIADYMRALSSPPEFAALALAGPVQNGTAHLTNIGWDADAAALAQATGLKKVFLLNDFVALARAAPALTSADVIAIKDGTPMTGGPFSIMGAGTGFGAALLAPSGEGYDLIATESGHASFAPTNALEIRLWEHLHAKAARVSIETILSGDGLRAIHEALHVFRGDVAQPLSAEEICRRADADADSVSAKALDLFCDIFGSVAGDIALIHGATGGVYLAGGILMKNQGSLQCSHFTERFGAKGIMSPYVANIPVKLIRSERAALKGAALWFADMRRRETAL